MAQLVGLASREGHLEEHAVGACQQVVMDDEMPFLIWSFNRLSGLALQRYDCNRRATSLARL